VVECLPGASLRAPPDSGQLQLAMMVKLGPISANFVGEGQVDFDDATRKGMVSGTAADRKSGSRIKGHVGFALFEARGPQAPTTQVALAIECTMGGTLAQFSREGIVRDLAQRLTDTFAANMRRELECTNGLVPAVQGSPSAVDVANCTAPSAAGVALPPNRSPPPKASLNLGAMLWAAFMDHIRQLFRRRPSG